MMEEQISFDLLAASLRLHGQEEETLLTVLSEKMLAALPAETTVQRAGGLLHRDRAVTALTITLGDRAWELRREQSRVLASVKTVVRGIALKTESLSLGKWLEGLAADLYTYSQDNEESAAALQRFLLVP